MLLGLLFNSPLVFLVLAGSLIISLTIHEFAHAFFAYKLGDPTAKYLGRVSLNPLKHLDPMGSLFMVITGFGWGRPVPVNEFNFHHPKRDLALVSLAGPLSNIILAIFVSLFLNILNISSGVIWDICVLLIVLNLQLCFFNLLPVHPLDGFKIVLGILPYNLAARWLETERYGVFILLILLMTRSTSYLITPLVETALKFLVY